MSFLKKTKSPLQILRKQRKHYLTYIQPKALRQNLMARIPDKETKLSAISFLVVDFETTGLIAKYNDIISIGWVEISNLQVVCASQEHIYINNDKKINHETAVINHIVPQMLRQGVSLHDAINALLIKAKGKILVVHGKVIEQCFLDFYMHQYFALPKIPLLWIDTLLIEKWRAVQKGMTLAQDNRLGSARIRYNLPQYTAHNALIDSISTAELLLAQIAHIYQHKAPTFANIYRISQ